jgi:hypothetical protein
LINFNIITVHAPNYFLSNLPSHSLNAIRSLGLSFQIIVPLYWTSDPPDATPDYIEWRKCCRSQNFTRRIEEKWENAWQIISEMKGLDKLRVVVVYDETSHYNYHIPETALLEPLRSSARKEV